MRVFLCCGEEQIGHVDLELADQAAGQIISTFVDSLKDRIEKVKQTDQVYDKIYKEEKKRAKKSR